MNKLLNRFAWILSLVFWFILAFIIIWIDTGSLRSDDIFFSAFWWALLSLFIKRLFLWEAFINSRLEYFKTKILEDPIHNSYGELNWADFTSEPTSFEKESLLDSEFHGNISKTNKYNDWLEILDNDYTVEELIDNKPDYSIATQENKVEKIDHTPWIFETYMSKIGEYIKDFFATNTLAKIWAILIFLAVVYFLKWVAGYFWEVIWSVWRLIIGFIIGFSTFWIGVYLHWRWNKNEWIILIRLSILINYGVILSWRYLIGEDNIWADWFLTEGITFLLLIFNTVFGVVTSLVYQSRTLLIFSFIFAYINPFIIWASSSGTPYTLLGYSIVVSLWGLFLSTKTSAENLVKQEVNSTHYNLLLYGVFILWSILIVLAPFTTETDWVVKVFSSVTLSAASIYAFWNSKWPSTKENNSWLVVLFIWAYSFIFLLLLAWGFHEGLLLNIYSYLTYIIVLLWFFCCSMLLFKKDSWNQLLQCLLFVPLIIFLGIILSGQAFSIIWLLIVFLAMYLFCFWLLQSFFTTIFSYCYFILVGVFIFLTYISLISEWVVFRIPIFIATIASGFIFLFSTYFFSFKKWLSYLYSIWTVLSIILLAPVLVFTSTITWLNSWDIIETGIVTTPFHVNVSVLTVVIFALSNWVLPFINKNLIQSTKSIENLIIWSLAWVLFIAFELYNFWWIYFPWVAQWLTFTILAIIYFIQSYLVVQKIWSIQEALWDDEKLSNTSLKNVFYTYAGISLSLFSFAVAFVFSDYPEIISTVWLFEATILYYFYSKIKDWKIIEAWNVLFIIWIAKFAFLLDIVEKWDYNFWNSCYHRSY